MCGGVAEFYEWKFETPEACCSNMLGHEDQKLCVADSLYLVEHYTYKWYMDSRVKKCKKDCPAGDDLTCDGHPSDYLALEMFDTPEACRAKTLFGLRAGSA